MLRHDYGCVLLELITFVSLITAIVIVIVINKILNLVEFKHKLALIAYLQREVKNE